MNQKKGKDENVSVALLLKHYYNVTGLRPELLKGLDSTLWHHLAKSFHIRTLPILHSSYQYEDGAQWEISEAVYPFDMAHMRKYSGRKKVDTHAHSQTTHKHTHALSLLYLTQK